MKNFQYKYLNGRGGFMLAGYLVFLILSANLISCTASKKAAVQDTTIVYFVRHAEKAKDDRRDPTLTMAGKERSERLAELLKEENVKAVYSTDYKRTRDTAAPTSSRFKCETQIYNHKTIDIVEVANAHKNQTVLVVGHSNSTPMLANDLLGEKRYEQFDESDYTNLIKVMIKDGVKEVELIKF